MRQMLSNRSLLAGIFLVGIAVCLSACAAVTKVDKPLVEFTTIPPVDEGSPKRLETVAGRVSGAQPGDKIVLFSKSGTWWVQPLVNQPFTDIRPDSTWTSAVHPGTEYAALLVRPDFHPPATADVLPAEDKNVIASAVVKGTGSLPATTNFIKFSGYEWNVRSKPSDRAGTFTEFDPKNAWTDEKGYLHMRISKGETGWRSAEIDLSRTLGYGSYILTVRDISHLEPAAVLSMFTWDDMEAGQNHREMNIEMTRWGDPASRNIQYVIQPYYLPANVFKFAAPTGMLTNIMRWEPRQVSFKTIRGNDIDSKAVPAAEHVFTSGTPSSEGETLHLSFFVFGYAKQPLEKEMEVVIEKFEYLP
jgi:hypothetical protein